MNSKTCITCKIEKELINFRKKNYKYKICISNTCIDCERIKARKYAAQNRESRKQYQKEYLKNNPNYIKEWKKKNRDKINKQYSNKIKTNIAFKIRKNVSRAINSYIKKNNSAKNDSFLKYVNYSIDDLKKHLEKLFEPWMNWDNYGRYNPKTWDDNDQNTWKWNIDHIIPQSLLSYTSMKDENFKKCWALENLRPFSAKQNSIDGSTRIRHINE